MVTIDRAKMAAEHDARRTLYDQGLTDIEIARRTGGKRNTITVWRRAKGLPTNVGPNTFTRLSAERRASRMLLYQLGWSDRHIAREQGVDRSSVRIWRHNLGLKSNFPSGISESRHPRPTVASLLKRVRAAIGRGLAKDIADDAASQMLMEVLDGTIAIDQIEKAARKYGSKAIEQFANKFGPRSLDEELGDSDGFRIIDMIEDERSSSWLEEMGATVW